MDRLIRSFFQDSGFFCAGCNSSITGRARWETWMWAPRVPTASVQLVPRQPELETSLEAMACRSGRIGSHPSTFAFLFDQFGAFFLLAPFKFVTGAVFVSSII
jgi:hypothetical protein